MIKVQVIGNYLVVTYPSGETDEFPTKELRYRDDGNNISLRNINNESQNASFVWTDLIDAEDNPFASLNDVLNFFRIHTGGASSVDGVDGDPNLHGSNIVVKYLENAGSNDMTVDGTTPVTFKATPPVGKKWIIARMLFYFSNGTSFEEDKFGDLTALTNGVSVRADGDEIVNFKDNVDIVVTMFDADGKEVYNKADKSISARFTFSKLGPVDGIEILDHVEGFSIVIQDDLTGLTMFRAKIEGIEYDL